MKRMSILLADDDLSTRITLSIALRGEGFEVDLAEDGLKALDKMKVKTYDWVISDIRMSGMDGIELAKEAKRLRPKCKIVVISAYGFPREAEGIDITRYFEKPVDIVGLCNLLKGKDGFEPASAEGEDDQEGPHS
ncbi:MAG: response regulator [bacterium]